MATSTTGTDTTDQTDTDALKADLSQLREDFANLRDNVRRRSNDQFRSRLNGAENRVSSWGHEIESRPVTSMAVAFGIGLLLGKRFTR